MARRSLVAVFVVLAAVSAGCGTAPTESNRSTSGDSRPDAAIAPRGDTRAAGAADTTAPAGSAAGTTADGSSSTSTTTSPPGGSAKYAVGSFWRDFTDTKRNRVLKTRVHFPANGVPGNAGAPKADGAFPLVLMAHGYQLPAGGYETILKRVAAAGYIVAAPAFPHTSQETGDGNRSDIVNQPADLSFAADALTELSRAPDSPIPEIREPNRIAVLGHSDGGLTATAISYNASYRDQRVVATVVMTGGIALFPGSYFTAGPFPPLLAIHARADETNGYNASVSLFDRVPSPTPRYLLTIEGGSHLGPYMFDSAMPALGQAIADFLDAYVLGADGAAARLDIDGNRPGAFSLQAG